MGTGDSAGRWVRDLADVDRTQVAMVGGKAALLGELSGVEGIRVPKGVCVTTDAFRSAVAAASIADELDALSQLHADDVASMAALTATIRRRIEEAPVPDEIGESIGAAVTRLGPDAPCAVRSSATVEDLPTASSAGQHDSFLGVAGPSAVLRDVRRCWASLFTERAVAYRLRHGIDHRTAQMAVVVQRMVDPRSAGVLFTADPVDGDRRVVSVEAVRGLADELVSGRSEPDTYNVRDGVVVTRTAGPEPVLSDAEVRELAALGRRIEGHLGSPQDVEWCIDDAGIHVVQSRPITTLFPVPGPDDGAYRVYVSVGHQQMMTDPMSPLGLSIWMLTTRAPMHEAGGRLFVDVTPMLGSPSSRAALVEGFTRSDPLIGAALQTVVDRDHELLPASDGPAAPPPLLGGSADLLEADPAIVDELVERTTASLRALPDTLAGLTGSALLDAIEEDVQELRQLLFDPRNLQVIMAAMEATWWLNDHLREWLGETNLADTLTLAAPGNVTSEMGLALLDVADVVRPHPEVVARLRDARSVDVLGELPALDGGEAVRDAIGAYLEAYGMRCVGEIDIARPRWREQPDSLIPLILAHVDNAAPGERERRVQEGRRAASRAADDVLARLRELPDGERAADETRRMIDRVRTFIGFREFPKYGMVSRYFAYRLALLGEADRLVEAGVIRERDDIFLLPFEELREAVRTRSVDHELIRRRRDDLRAFAALSPPRVITSHGQAVAGAYPAGDRPAGALVGLAVSAGVVEGRARVLRDLDDAVLEPGDILVTPFTDPSWSPVFVAISGLVTEVGGLMTHGAVVAREYGLPAVVGVEHATGRIRDGQRIRLDGTHGHVELL